MKQIVVSILVATSNFLSYRQSTVDAFLHSQPTTRTPRCFPESQVIVRRYEPLPNDSLGNFQENSSLQQQPPSGLPSQSASPSSTPSPAYDATTPDLSVPTPSISALQVATLLMDALQNAPNPQQSLELCFLFSSDRCRAAVGGSLEAFVKYAHNPTFGSLVHCQDWRVLSVGPVIPGSTHRGDMQTVLIEITKPLTVQAALATKAKDERQSGRRRPTMEERLRAREQRQRRQEEEEYGDDDENDDEFGDVMDAEEDGKKTFLWTLQKERRPPRQDCWLVHEVLYKRNAFLQTF
jgi:hypothetical protein